MACRIIKYLILITLVLNGLIFTSILAQEKQEVVLTLKGVSSNEKMDHFNKAEELRLNGKYREAIKEYEKVLSPGEKCGKEYEAHYDIGICHIFIGKNDDAEAIFKKVIETYPNNGEAVAYSKYCLSWVDVQRENYYAAIDRIEKTLQAKTWMDSEFSSRAEFQIGRIYLAFLHDYKKAEYVFQAVLRKYPDSKITEHPFLQDAKSRMSN